MARDLEDRLQVNRVRLLIMVVVLVPLVVIAANILLYDSTPIASSPGGYTSFTAGGKTFHLTYVATNQSMLAEGTDGHEGHGHHDDALRLSEPRLLLLLDVWRQLEPRHDMGRRTSGGGSGSVVYLALDSPPCHVTVVCTNYTPTAKANFVIEAKGGFAAANGIKLGTPVTIN